MTPPTAGDDAISRSSARESIPTCAVLAHPLVPGVAAAQRETRSLPRPAPMTAILDSLEHVALTATDASARARAALTMTDAGRLQAAEGPASSARSHPRRC